MKAYLSGWESLCASSSVARFVDCNLRGIGQVMFQDNPLSGALFFAAIVWGSVAAGMPQVAICGAIAGRCMRSTHRRQNDAPSPPSISMSRGRLPKTLLTTG